METGDFAKKPTHKKIEKRKNMRTSDIIQKKARKEDWSSKMDETEKETQEFDLSDHVEHNKEYFFEHSVKIGCKLCSFKGKFIVYHYKTSHPESEVLISRINPDITEILIEDAIRNRQEYDKDHLEFEEMTCNFKCPFCLMLIKDTTNMCYNHIASHTGEYCFHCNHCSYWTHNPSNIHSHLNQTHNKIRKTEYKMVYLNPKISKYIFGYICSECNFIQLSQTMVEKHAMVYHPRTTEIHRVNLGVLLYNDIVDENCANKIHLNEKYDTHNHNLKMPVEAKEPSNLSVQMEELEEVNVKIEAQKLDNDPHSIEFTTFVCQPDLNIKQESESHEIEIVPTEFPTFIYQPDLDIKQDSENDRTEMLQINENTKKVKSKDDVDKVLNSKVKLRPKMTQLVSTNKDDLKCTSVLTDIPMTDTEKQNRKCPKAVAVMMKPPLLKALYKCPKYDCTFATKLPLSFQKHFTGHHSILTNTLVSCLYCDYRVSYSSYVIHLEVRHGHCLFGCGNCFYRTTNSYFVTMHHELAHPNTEFNILQLEVVTSNRIRACTTPINLKKLVLPYNCKGNGFLSCPFKTLYFDEYLKHMKVIHQVDGLCLTLSEHKLQRKAFMEKWLMKEVGPFQCRYCRKATVTHQEMGRHQAVFHAQEQCLFYYRKFVSNDTVTTPDQVNMENPSFINHLVHLPDQVYLCNFKLMDGLHSSTSAKMTNWESEVSLPLLQSSAKETESGSDQSTVSLGKPEVCSTLVSDTEYLLDKSDSLCLNEQLKDGDTHNGPTCKWKNCYETYDSQTALVKHINKKHVELQRGEEFTCFWINCSKKLKPFNARRNLSAHMKVHIVEKSNKCVIQGCNKAFSQQVTLKIHQRSHIGKRPYLCQFSNCFKSFSSVYNRDYHQRVHYDTEAYACQVTGCSKKYSSPGSLYTHMKKHTVDKQPKTKQKSVKRKQNHYNFVLEKFSDILDGTKCQSTHCNTCKWKNCYQTYDSQTVLIKHIKKNHIMSQRGEEFTCLWKNCLRKLKPFKAWYKLLTHMEVHCRENPNKCSFQDSDKASSQQVTLKIHQGSRTRKKLYLCRFSNCSKSFSSCYTRRYHQRIHYDTEAYACQVTGCSKKYTTSGGLYIHMKKHMVDEELKVKWKLLKNKEKQDNFVLKKAKYQSTHCDTGCNKALSEQATPKIHQRSDTSKRPYLCKFSNCLKSFSSSYTRRYHQRIHYDTEAYACQITGCSKKYTTPSNLSNHMKKHMVDEQSKTEWKSVEKQTEAG